MLFKPVQSVFVISFGCYLDLYSNLVTHKSLQHPWGHPEPDIANLGERVRQNHITIHKQGQLRVECALFSIRNKGNFALEIFAGFVLEHLSELVSEDN